MNKFSKYAIILPSNKRNGGNRVLRAVHNALHEANYNARIIEVESNESSERLNAVPMVNRWGRYIATIFRLWSMVRQAIEIGRAPDIDYIILSDPIQAIIKPLYRDKRVIRYVQSDDYALFEQNTSANFIMKFFYKALFLISQRYKYEALIYNSQATARNYKKTLNTDKIKKEHAVVYPPVFTSGFAAKKVVSSGDENKVAVITSSHPRKGFWRLSKIIKETIHFDLQFLIISQSDFNYENSRVNYIKPINDEEYIEALISCKYVLNLSSFEGFGLPILEAVALGLLPLSIINEGLREIYDPNIIKIFQTTKEFDDAISHYKGMSDIPSYQRRAMYFVDKFSIEKFNENIIREIVPRY